MHGGCYLFVGAMIATNKSKQITGDDLLGSIHDVAVSNNNATADGIENNRTSPRSSMSACAGDSSGTKADVDGCSEAFRTNDEILLGTKPSPLPPPFYYLPL